MYLSLLHFYTDSRYVRRSGLLVLDSIHLQCRRLLRTTTFRSKSNCSTLRNKRLSGKRNLPWPPQIQSRKFNISSLINQFAWGLMFGTLPPFAFLRYEPVQVIEMNNDIHLSDFIPVKPHHNVTKLFYSYWQGNYFGKVFKTPGNVTEDLFKTMIDNFVLKGGKGVQFQFENADACASYTTTFQGYLPEIGFQIE